MNLRAGLPALCGSLLVLGALTGCSGSAAAQPKPTATARPVHGSMTIARYHWASATGSDGETCATLDGYDDIRAGAEVDVVDGASTVLATAPLDDGIVDGATRTCVFSFTVPDVPTDAKVYGVKVGRAARGTVHFARQALFSAGALLTLGE